MDPKRSLSVNVWLDQELLRAMRSNSGLKEKVSEIFDLLQEPVYRYLLVAVGDVQEAEDLTQEVFLRLFQCLDKGQVVFNIRAWVFRVAHNLAITRHKRAVLLTSLDVEGLGKQPAPEDPERTLLEQEQYTRLEKALASLSPEEAQCLALRAEGLTYREIAEVVGMRLPNVFKFLGRVMSKLMSETYD
ncbi:MAG: RNA polymerase sigma factor [Acidobacteriota bacterium]